MQTLNLARKEYGDIDYEIIEYPDGQLQLVIKSELNRKDEVTIICRLRNGNDLFVLQQAMQIMETHRIHTRVSIKYLLAARTDRIFSFNQAHTLDVVLDTLMQYECGFSVLEPHSQLPYKFGEDWDIGATGYDYHAYPDQGAKERYGSHGDAILCSKTRNVETGELSGFKIDNPEIFKGGSILLKDDLCDGGGTFLGLAGLLRELNPTELAIQITHAIQQQGIEKLAKVYDKVIITNSYADWDLVELPDNVVVIDALR